MTSDASTAYVWIWLPDAEVPVVAGRVDQRADRLIFGYGRSYLERPDAISIYEPELPLRPGPIEPLPTLQAAGCLLDAGPDSWGQRVILNRLLGRAASDTSRLGDLTYLLHAGSDRIGALDFQVSPDEHVPHGTCDATLEDLARAAEMLQAGEPVPPELETALTAGSSVGGARPKALLRDGDRRLIAKFSSLTDTPETAPGEASYANLVPIIRRLFTDAGPTLRELFERIIFNILSGNTDDHARNHAAFWDGRALILTPAYDICPYLRGGGEATQAMIIGTDDDPYRFSQVTGCVERAGVYGLTRAKACEIIDRQRTAIDEHWDDVCQQAELAKADRDLFHRLFPHPYALEGYVSPAH
jgi:serine/threonine-protein kinase HipA